MNITFLIGNGFDINLGLKTKYSDFYPYFERKASESNIIKKWLRDDELLWSDLEEQLGEALENVKEGEQEKFYEDKAELDGLLLEYLEQEQGRFSAKGREQEIADEMARSLANFYAGLPEEGKNAVASTCEFYNSEQFKYNFISFNYTDVLDQIIELSSELKTPIATHKVYGGMKNDALGVALHLHGTLKEDMILGVNDVEQIHSDLLRGDEDFLDTFIKRRMNENIGQRKTERVRGLITGSRIICIFGMSMGNTDKMWWEEIVRWLNSSFYNILIIFYKGFEEELKKKLPIKTIPLNKKILKETLEKGRGDMSDSVIENIKKKIFISYNADIFNFKEAEAV